MYYTFVFIIDVHTCICVHVFVMDASIIHVFMNMDLKWMCCLYYRIDSAVYTTVYTVVYGSILPSTIQAIIYIIYTAADRLVALHYREREYIQSYIYIYIYIYITLHICPCPCIHTSI